MTNSSNGNRPVVVLQHAKSETPGLIEGALQSKAKALQYVRTFEGQAIPRNADEYAALIVMGGPMGVYETDRYPFLVQEMKLIEGFLKNRLPVLGVCLGSQLLAATLGAKVQKGRQKEVGWYPIELSENGRRDVLWQELPSRFVGFHWHGDIFDLPPDACLLASSGITPVQAYRYDIGVYGILFHLEVTENHIRGMLHEFGDEIREENMSVEKILEDTNRHVPTLQRIGMTIFSRWAELI